MIYVKELRIGNWVTFAPDKGEFIVSEVDGFNIGLEHVNGLECNDVNPIPVTEEWLVKLGFSKSKYLEQVKGEVFRIICSNEDDFCIYEDGGQFNLFIEAGDPHYDIWGIEIKHVHQLQNLYFALTGEELTIK